MMTDPEVSNSIDEALKQSEYHILKQFSEMERAYHTQTQNLIQDLRTQQQEILDELHDQRVQRRRQEQQERGRREDSPSRSRSRSRSRSTSRKNRRGRSTGNRNDERSARAVSQNKAQGQQEPGGNDGHGEEDTPSWSEVLRVVLGILTFIFLLIFFGMWVHSKGARKKGSARTSKPKAATKSLAPEMPSRPVPATSNTMPGVTANNKQLLDFVNNLSVADS